MNRAICWVVGIVVWAGTLLAGSMPASAFTCGQVHLKDAWGVIGPSQKYSVDAQCSAQLTAYSKETKLTWEGLSTTVTNPSYLSFTVLGKASWDRKTGKATESLILSGDVSGQRQTTGICNEDPFLKDPPGGPATCQGVNASAKIEAGPLLTVFGSPIFFLARTVSFVEAQALSQKNASKPPVPPPPPPKAGDTPKVERKWQTVGKAKQALSPGALALPKPNLSIVGAKPLKIDPACQNVTHLFTAGVSIRNSGLPLAAGKGSVFVKEFGGASLTSFGVPLPALGSNETKVVEIPVGTIASFASALPGQHKLTVGLNPVLAEGHESFVKPAAPYEFQVMFPPGYCQAKLDKSRPAGKAQPVPPAGAPPLPGASAPSGQTSDPRALNPQPEVPSKPKKKSKPEREEKHLPAVQ